MEAEALLERRRGASSCTPPARCTSMRVGRSRSRLDSAATAVGTDLPGCVGFLPHTASASASCRLIRQLASTRGPSRAETAFRRIAAVHGEALWQMAGNALMQARCLQRKDGCLE